MSPNYFSNSCISHRLAAILLIGCFTAMMAFSHTAAAQTGETNTFQLSLNDGSVITVEINDRIFEWTDVLEDGEMRKRKVNYDDINQLILSASPASEQVANIRRLLNALSSPDYLKREKAEEQLSDKSIGGAFKSLIESLSDHENLEVRFRVDRIIQALVGEGEEMESEFDRMTLADGTVLDGDAGSFKLRCNFRGRDVTFSRSQIAVISSSLNTAKAPAKEKLVQVNLFHDHKKEFYQDHQNVVDFSTSPSGMDLASRSDVSNKFIPVGLKMATELNGFIGISGYGFKFPALPVGDNSICVFETVGENYSKRFRGVMEFTFCLPNQDSVPAGVHEFGLFIARVNHSRDLIMEAYNADGHLLACVESTDQPCVFTGVKSSELITRVRVLSNPHLFRVDRAIDEDFAVDSVCYSDPIFVANPKLRDVEDEPLDQVVRLRNGDLLKSSDDLRIDGTSVSLSVAGDKVNFPLKQVGSIQFGNAGEEPKDPQWTVSLPDQSVIYVDGGKTFTSTKFEGLSFEPKNVDAIWCSRNPLRYPVAGDFDDGKNVLVFPTCRIIDNVEFTATGFSWNRKAQRLIQPLFTGKESPDDEDPTPDISEIEFEDPWPENIPSIWLTQPKSRLVDEGLIRLVDGQQLSLAKGSQFELIEIASKNVTIRAGGKKVVVPIKDIVSLEIPADF